MRTYGLSEQQQDDVSKGFRTGESLSRIAQHQRVPMQHVRRYLAQTGGVRPAPSVRSSRQLSAADREEISRRLACGESFRAIGQHLRRPHTTVAREVRRNGGRESYRAQIADSAADVRRARPKPSKLAVHARLRAEVETGLELDWPPQQISRRLVIDHPADLSMRVSHETIYLSLFQPARKALRRGLTRHLRGGRLMRHPKVAGQASGRGRIRDMTPIADRPLEVEDRLVAGHWEGDLVMGRRPSAVATLVERTTRRVRLVALPDGIRAAPVRVALTADLLEVAPSLRRTLTWDRGKEMAEHAQFTLDTGCPVYFCNPGVRGSAARTKTPIGSCGSTSTRTAT